MREKKRVLITHEKAGRYFDIFQEDIMADLKAYADVIENDLGRPFTIPELIERVKECDAIITSWGTPRIDLSVVKSAPKLKIIAHAAGSVKNLIAEEVWDAGIVVTNAASVMGVYVGEFALLAALALLRSLPKYTYGAPDGAWDGLPCDGNETLVRKRVGLIGLGHTARAFVRFLAPFECDLVAYDPYVSPQRAAELGVSLVSLEELLTTSKVVSLHAPITEETKGMLGAREFKMLQDGAVFVNTARGILIDQDALYEELKTGRIKAVLDVTYPEPLPPDHPLRTLPNVVITPHIAGPTVDGRRDMFRCVVDDLKRFWSGETPQNIVTKEMLKTMA
jgi:phosphoglycerate dehydrogenase-like enzyme